MSYIDGWRRFKKRARRERVFHPRSRRISLFMRRRFCVYPTNPTQPSGESGVGLFQPRPSFRAGGTCVIVGVGGLYHVVVVPCGAVSLIFWSILVVAAIALLFVPDAVDPLERTVIFVGAGISAIGVLCRQIWLGRLSIKSIIRKLFRKNRNKIERGAWLKTKRHAHSLLFDADSHSSSGHSGYILSLLLNDAAPCFALARPSNNNFRHPPQKMIKQS